MELHLSVLLKEAIDALAIKPKGTYVDATLGRCGHAQETLKHLEPEGTFIGIDQDQEAIDYAKQHLGQDPRVRLVHANFSQVFDELSDLKGKLDGVLIDLGICSTHLDDPTRGFSFRFDAPLDMRMDQRQSTTAADLVNSLAEKELANLIFRLGEEKQSRRIARAICEARKIQPIETTFQLVDVITSVKPKRAHERIHPATKTFQALRIAVNKELEVAEEALKQFMQYLAPQGRLVVISFHSLEDRIVKQLFRAATSHNIPAHIPVKCDKLKTGFKLIGKAIRPTAFETRQNPRARSAVMRILEKNEI